MPNPLRKNLDQVLENAKVEITQDHINDWHYCTSSAPFKALLKEYPTEKMGTFNITAAIFAPKSIRYRQRDSDFEEGKRGDYQLVDRNGGKMALPSIIFKRLFT